MTWRGKILLSRKTVRIVFVDKSCFKGCKLIEREREIIEDIIYYLVY